MRTKEGSEDYRYFPDPDLPPLVLTSGRLARLRPRCRNCLRRARPAWRRRTGSARTMPRRGAHGGDGRVLRAGGGESGDAAAVCRWMRGELTRRLAEAGLAIEHSRVTPEGLGALIRMAAAGLVSASAAKQVLARMMATGGAADEIARAEGLLQESDAEALGALVDGIAVRARGPGCAVPRRQARRRGFPRGPGDQGQRRQGESL